MNDSGDKKPRGKRLKRAGLWSVGVIFALTAAAAIALVSVIGARLSAPDWLRARITESINADLQGVSLRFGDVAVVLQDDMVPRLWLRDVTVRNTAGTPLAKLSDVQSAVALRPLLRGDLQPGYIRLSGAQLILRRAQDGAVDLSVGDAAAPVEQAGNLAQLIGQLDALLQSAQFAALDEVEADNLTLRYEDARAGRAWTVDGGRMSLERDGDDLRLRGDFALLGGRDYATTLEMNYASRIGQTAAEIGISFQDMPARDIAGQSPALAWLGALDAPISGALRASVDEAGALGPLNATLQIGAGALRPTEATRPVSFDSVRSYFTYDPSRQVIEFNELAIDSKWVSTRVEGRAYLVGVEQGWPREIVTQVTLGEIRTNPDGLYPERLTLEAATLDMRLQLDPFVLSLGQMSLQDKGERLVLTGEARAEPEGWHVALDGKMGALTPERLLQLWPESLTPNTRTWIDENIRKAELRNLQLAVRSLPTSRPDLFLSVDFADMQTRFIKDVPEIEAASGHLSLLDNRFVVTTRTGHVTAGQGGRVDISGTSFEIPNVQIKRAPARVRLKTSSTITAVLSLLNEEPFRFLDKAGQLVTLADGRAALGGTLDFLLIKDLQPEEVAFDVTGRLEDVRSETLVPGRVLNAAALDVRATKEDLVVSGDGRIGQVPFNGRFRAELAPDSGGQSDVRGWIEISERFADEFRIGLPPGSLTGAGRGQIEIDFEKGAPGAFRLTSTLAGVGLRLPQLGWSLSSGATGELEVSGRLGEPPSLDRVRIAAGGLSARGTVALRPDGQLDRASFTRVQVGDWIDAPVELVGRGAGAVPLVRVLGGSIDLRQTSLAGGGDNTAQGRRNAGGPVSLILDRLQISEGIALTDFRAELDMSNGANGQFSGKLNEYAPVTGTVVPQAGRSAFRIRSSDAGGFFASAGLLKQARNGTLEVILTPGRGAGVYEGKMEARGNMRLKDAPAMAALLNALSVIGILEQMGGEGIHFNQVDARFQLSPDRVTLYSGSAIGASMGISMDGYYYMGNGQMDMQGVISPLYLVNAVGGIFTRRGEGLIGFNYRLRGQASNPRVEVNPLSALTPGMFRELFRRPPPRQPESRAGGQAAPSTQPTQDSTTPTAEQTPQTNTGTDR